MKNKNVPELRFPEFHGDGEWEDVKFSKKIKLYRGSSPRPIAHFLTASPTGVNWIKIGDTKHAKNNIISFVEEKISYEGSLKSRKVDIGELILANSMSYGKTYQLAIEGCIYDGWFVLREYESYFYKPFLLQLLNSDYMQKQYTKFSAGGIVQNISSEIVYETNLFDISLPEQQKIADCLSSLDDVIRTQTQKVEKLAAHKKGLLQKLFPQEGQSVPEFRFPEFRGAGEWEKSFLKDISINLDSKRVPITKSTRVSGSIPYYGASGVIDFVKDYIFDEELLCVSEDGANLVDRVYPIAFSIQGRTWVNNHAHVLKFPKKAIQVLIENLLNHRDISDYITGMAQPKLNKENLEKINFLLPTIDKEQQKIADCLASLDCLILQHTKKLDALKKHKQGLMQGLFPKKEV